MKRIGFFGGSFNPPTIAHLEIVNLALKEVNLDKIVIVPMGDKYEKKDLISFEHRFKMLNLLFNKNDKVEVSDIQKNQKKRTYAIDTFKIIDLQYPNDQRFFIMGLDNFSKINEWKDSNKLLENYNFIVFKRNNIEITGLNKNIKFLDVNQDISSSLARKKIINSETLENIISPEVEKYIHKNELYKKGEV